MVKRSKKSSIHQNVMSSRWPSNHQIILGIMVKVNINHYIDTTVAPAWVSISFLRRLSICASLPNQKGTLLSVPCILVASYKPYSCMTHVHSIRMAKNTVSWQKQLSIYSTSFNLYPMKHFLQNENTLKIAKLGNALNRLWKLQTKRMLGSVVRDVIMRNFPVAFGI